MDNYVDLVNQIVTPKDYQTPLNTKFKARALHYGSQIGNFTKNSWILHMDEETYMDVKNAHRLVNFCYDWNYKITELKTKPIFAFGNCT